MYGTHLGGKSFNTRIEMSKPSWTCLVPVVVYRKDKKTVRDIVDRFGFETLSRFLQAKAIILEATVLFSAADGYSKCEKKLWEIEGPFCS